MKTLTKILEFSHLAYEKSFTENYLPAF